MRTHHDSMRALHKLMLIRMIHRLTDCRPESVPVDDHNLDHEHRITHTLANSDSRSLFVSDIVVNSTA